MGAVRRGRDDRSEGRFSCIRRKERGPADHPLRAIRALADEVLAGLNGRFAALFSATVFSQNRDRRLCTDVAQDVLAGLMALKQVKRLLSAEHFSADGTLIDAWASMKSFRAKDGSGTLPGPGPGPGLGPGERDFHGEKRSNDPKPRPPTPMRGSTGRRSGKRAGCATWGMCSSKTVVDWRSRRP